MGNLGDYQIMTTVTKKLGGPKKALATVVAITVVTEKIVEGVGKTAYKNIKKLVKVDPKNPSEYVIKDNAITNEGVKLVKNTKIKILEQDGNAVLIEINGDENSPYFVAYDLISKITDFRRD